MKPEELVRLLSTLRVRPGDELGVQLAIDGLLRTTAVGYTREAKCGDGRVDFLVGGIALEVKVKGSRNDVLRQLHDYASDPAVTAVVLCTTCARHAMPNELNGKPVYVVRPCTL